MKKCYFLILILSFCVSANAQTQSIQVESGWNLLSLPLKVTDSLKSSIFPSAVSLAFIFQGGYQTKDTKQNGSIILSSDTIPASGVPCPGMLTVKYAGKTYNTVQIGNQCWLRENLDVGIIIDGTQEQTNNSMIEKYCYNNDPAKCDTLGGLYLWNEAMQYSTAEGSCGICPSGFHIPTYAEYQTLNAAVGGDGNSLKKEDQGSGAGQGTNITGFSALLSGTRYHGGYFYGLGYTTYFWSSSENYTNLAYYMNLYYYASDVYLNDNYKEFGFSVRCVKD
jgi:uncharacterized protein (TIGR02145 family)